MNQLKFVSVVFALMAACSTKHITGANTNANPSQNIDKNLILEMVNKARSTGCQCGDTWYPKAQAVSWNNQLESAAAEHSSDMYKKNISVIMHLMAAMQVTG